MAAAMTQLDADDESESEPEYTDDELREVVDDFLDLCDENWTLDHHVDSLYVQQLDNPYTDDAADITVFMAGDVGSGATKATIIQEVLDSDVPVRLTNTADGHGQLTFEVDALEDGR